MSKRTRGKPKVEEPAVAAEPTPEPEPTTPEATPEPAPEPEPEPIVPELDTDERPGLEKAAPLLVSDKHLETVIESLLFVADHPLPANRVARLARTSTKEAQRIIATLAAHYEGRGIELVEVAGGFQFRSAPSSAPFVRDLVAKKPVRLTRAQIETLSITAYRQPITRPEVDEIRGVDSGSAIKVLVEKSLLKILGRKDEPGRPLLYGTTSYFLEFFGLPSLAELPTLREHAELTDESRQLFERRMGESIDTIGDIEGDAHHYTDEEIEAAEAAARAREEAAQGEMPLESEIPPAPNAADDEDDEDDEDEDDDE
jgi:segregation and condensation protein B